MAMNIETALEEFLIACRADGLSAATVRWYRTQLAPMVVHLPQREISTVTVSELRRWIVSLESRETRYDGHTREKPGGLSEESLKSHKRALLRFWKWCAEEFDIDNPAKRIKHPGVSKGNPKNAIRPEDMWKMIQQSAITPPGGYRVISIRDAAMLVFLADTGCRASGILSLETRDINFDKRYALVTEKRRKGKSNIRRVNFLPATGELIMKYLEARPDHQSDALWLAFRKGQPIGPLKYYGFYAMLKRLAGRAGVDGRFNPHAFRHGFAQHYLLSGGDMSSLSQLFGHSALGVTADNYGQFEQNALSEQHDKFSPINNL